MLESSKPIWRGDLYNCGLILGTNALMSLGFVVSHSNGTVIEPTGDVKRESVARVFQIVLTKDRPTHWPVSDQTNSSKF